MICGISTKQLNRKYMRTILLLVVFLFTMKHLFLKFKTEERPKIVHLLTSESYDWNRMGNKMFRYASLLGIAHTNGRRPFVGNYTPIDISKMFKMTHAGEYHNYTSWPLVHDSLYAYDDPKMKHLPDVDIKLGGNLQSWKYFEAIKDEIKREFTLQEHIKMQSDQILQAIRHRFNSSDLELVGVHVRQRDSYSNPVTLEAPVSFFNNAFTKMRSLLGGSRPLFVVAGNNLAWCRDNLKGPDVVVLDDAPAEVHFAVLASCQHGVVSIGTFGWWSSWLSGGHVIYYVRFPIPESIEANGFVAADYYPPHWIPVDHKTL